MARVTNDEVLAIVDEDIILDDGDSSEAKETKLAPFINTANLIVTNYCVGYGYDDDQLKDIELWLSAHFLAIRYPALSIKSENVDGVQASYYGVAGKMLESTIYGQQAKIIDVKGTLNKLGKRPISFEVFDHIDGGTGS